MEDPATPCDDAAGSISGHLCFRAHFENLNSARCNIHSKSTLPCQSVGPTMLGATDTISEFKDILSRCVFIGDWSWFQTTVPGLGVVICHLCVCDCRVSLPWVWAWSWLEKLSWDVEWLDIRCHFLMLLSVSLTLLSSNNLRLKLILSATVHGEKVFKRHACRVSVYTWVYCQSS